MQAAAWGAVTGAWAQLAHGNTDGAAHGGGDGLAAAVQTAAFNLREQLPWARRVQITAAAALLAAACLIPLRRAPPGAARLAAAAALLLPVNLLVPLLFDAVDEIISRAVVTTCFAWMANCKVQAAPWRRRRALMPLARAPRSAAPRAPAAPRAALAAAARPHVRVAAGRRRPAPSTADTPPHMRRAAAGGVLPRPRPPGRRALGPRAVRADLRAAHIPARAPRRRQGRPARRQRRRARRGRGALRAVLRCAAAARGAGARRVRGSGCRGGKGRGRRG